jgi:hypothetical protein
MNTFAEKGLKYVHDKASIVIEQFTTTQHTCRFIFKCAGREDPTENDIKKAPVFNNDLMLCVDTYIVPYLKKQYNPPSNEQVHSENFHYECEKINKNIIMIIYGYNLENTCVNTCVVMFYRCDYLKDKDTGFDYHGTIPVFFSSINYPCFFS